MVNYIGFLLVIFFTNIIQGITGCAGTILAMPPSIMLVGYPAAKPVLNVLGLLSGIYVFAGNYKRVCWKELKKIVGVMAAGILAGIFIKGLFDGRERLLYKFLGIFVILLAIQGGWSLGKKERAVEAEAENNRCGSSLTSWLLLPLAGIVHGIFVSGGPVLIGYMTRRIQDKVSFRATISAVWIFLNSMILADDIRTGLWNAELVKVQIASLPFLLGGMFIGGKLYVRMSQRLFMVITYLLLFISGVSLLVK